MAINYAEKYAPYVDERFKSNLFRMELWIKT